MLKIRVTMFIAFQRALAQASASNVQVLRLPSAIVHSHHGHEIILDLIKSLRGTSELTICRKQFHRFGIEFVMTSVAFTRVINLAARAGTPADLMLFATHLHRACYACDAPAIIELYSKNFLWDSVTACELRAVAWAAYYIPPTSSGHRWESPGDAEVHARFGDGHLSWRDGRDRDHRDRTIMTRSGNCTLSTVHIGSSLDIKTVITDNRKSDW
ncbi:uncharacterized protein PHACADRAFT_183041 [Phanerochaete carnosa HHB-10118-sp]|uniref:Secreted protein n=1 Tax=Phanerochaete carnosa (strain HHB-10118-sp) TaxID=650164 RepID=K5VXN1_PHACS|nr:uncharacterized protein PHACADRAFT_183041 [Phanerochaete carnosa HHB-10118-sp]EKM56308.1 hypothetical protein PHACADRAFT_183041 [Phanerochaete carnosa HHB-10118-sp]